MNSYPTISDIVNGYKADLIDKGYCDQVRWRYHSVCYRLLDWGSINHIDVFSEEVAKNFAIEKVGAWSFASNLGWRKRETLRVLHMLVCFSKNLPYSSRLPSSEHVYNTILGDLLDGFLEWVHKSISASASTLKIYELGMYKLDGYLYTHKISLQNISIDVIEKFLCSEDGLKVNRAIIRRLLDYLYLEDIITEELSRKMMKVRKHRSEPIPTTYTEEEIALILKAIDRSTAVGKRAYLAILLAAQYGMRISDILNLRFSNIDWENNKISIIQKKTGIPIEYPLIASVGNAIYDYVKNGRPNAEDDLIIISHNKHALDLHLSCATIQKSLGNAMRIAEIKDWQTKKHGFHSLRFSFATNLSKNGLGYFDVQSLLGHVSSETTRTYIKADVERLRHCSLNVPVIKSPLYKSLKI